MKKIDGKTIKNLQKIRSFAIMNLRKMTPSSNPLKKDVEVLHKGVSHCTRQHQATPGNTRQVDVPVFKEQLQGMKLQSIVERGY